MALGTTLNWDVRTGGSDSNGGAFLPGSSGTDWSQQTAAQYALTGLTTSGAAAIILTTSASSDMVGNVMQVISGTNFIAGFYQILSISAGISITVDRNVTTGIGASGAANIGGSLLTISAANTAAINGNTIWVNGSGSSYVLATTIALSNTFSGAPKRLIGYGTTHGDNGAYPLITTATNSINLFNTSGVSGYYFGHLSFSNTASTRARAFSNPSAEGYMLHWSDCKFSGFTNGVEMDNIVDFLGPALFFDNCYFTGCTNAAIKTSSSVSIDVCYFASNSGDGVFADLSGQGQTSISDSVFYSNNRGIITSTSTSSAGTNNPLAIRNCAFVSHTSHGIFIQDVAQSLKCKNSIFYGNGGFGVSAPSQLPNIDFNYNAYGSNTSGNLSNVTAGANDQTLTADPFTAKASNDFSLNTTTGGGASCRNAGSPGACTSQTFGTGYADIGALRHQDSGGGTVVSIASVYIG